MFQGRSFLAIIPARGGSKRLPNKNILDFAGKPLIGWTIEAALNCPYLDEVVVTTDDIKIANVAVKSGAKVPFLRPSDLASDKSTSFEAVKHAIEFYTEELGKQFDFVVLLQPTSPLRKASDIIRAIEFLVEKNSEAIISVCETEHSPRWMNTLSADLDMSNFLDESEASKRSQDLEVYYRINGAIFICNAAALLVNRTFYLKEKAYAFIMDKYDSIDIDTYYDFIVAKALLNRSSQPNVMSLETRSVDSLVEL